MFKVDLGNKKTEKKELDSLLYSSKDGSKTFTETCEAVVLISNVFNTNGITKLSDLILLLKSGKLKWSDDVAVYKIVDMVINISNNPELDTDYTYLVNMMKHMNVSYREVEKTEYGHGSHLKVEYKLTDIKNDLPIDEVFALLMERLGYRDTLTVVKVLKNYDWE